MDHCLCCDLQVLPEPTKSHLIIVDLVKSLETLHTNAVLQLVKEVVKKPNQIKGEQVMRGSSNLFEFSFCS